MATIKVTRGGCGINYTDANGNARHTLKTPEHGPFECDNAQAARLVRLGVAEYVGNPAPVKVHVEPVQGEQDQEGEELAYHIDVSALELMPYNELKKLAKDMGINPVGMKKADLVQAIAEVEVEPGEPLYDSEDDVPDLTVADPE